MNVPFLDLKTQYKSIKSEIGVAIQNVMDDCAFVQGPYLKKFENDFADYLGIQHVVGVNSGTSALAIILKSLRIIHSWPVHEWEAIIPANTFIATAESVLQAGGRPVLVDIDEQTYNMDPGKIEKVISKRTKVIIPVHLYGQPADMDKLITIANKYNLMVVEDAAQAHGAKYLSESNIENSKWKNISNFSHATSFSFYVSKNLGAYGDGGAVGTNDDEIADFIRMHRDHGSRVKYEHEFIGNTDRLDDIQAAILNVKLKYLDEWNKRRKINADLYNKYFSGEDGVIIPKIPNWAKPSWHLYVIRVSNREQLMIHLKENGVGCGCHYKIPLHLQPALNFLNKKNGDFPVTEKVMNEIISIPMYPELNENQIKYVVQKIKNFVV